MSPPPPPGISERIGSATCADGSRAFAYRALRDLICSVCGNIIAASQVFTRRTPARAAPTLSFAATPPLVARCRECAPFVTTEDEIINRTATSFSETETQAPNSSPRKPSALLAHLLRGTEHAHIETHPKPQAEDDKGILSPCTNATSDLRAKTSAALTPAEAVHQRLAPALRGVKRQPSGGKSSWRGARGR